VRRLSRVVGGTVVAACALGAATTAAAAPGCAATKGHVLTGVVLSALDCRPIRGARVELWQANASGRYVRATSATVLVDRSGRFRFEGPYPAPYGGGRPHIHLRVVAPGHEVLLSRYEPLRGARRGTVRLVLVPHAL
jgi:protocatechuate 3,4-dioxygenase beta subunit